MFSYAKAPRDFEDGHDRKVLGWVSAIRHNVVPIGQKCCGHDRTLLTCTCDNGNLDKYELDNVINLNLIQSLCFKKKGSKQLEKPISNFRN